jgi:hypothetical protein
MPFRDENTSAFGPDDLDILTAAFNAAWEQLATTDGKIGSEDQIELLKKRLATCILACATPGCYSACNFDPLSGVIGVQN